MCPTSDLWSRLLEPGRLILLSGDRAELRAFHQELAHYVLHEKEGHVLWCDGDHGFNPYDFAELNLQRGFPAEWGAQRLLVKRCMTPFQWDTVLTKHIAEKLYATPSSLVLAAPFDGLYSTDELTDWEREDYIRFCLKHLKALALRHKVPVVISVDMARWCKAHPLIAWEAFNACDARFALRPAGDGWTALQVHTGLDLATDAVRQLTLFDFAPIASFKAQARPLISLRSVPVQEAEA